MACQWGYKSNCIYYIWYSKGILEGRIGIFFSINSPNSGSFIVNINNYLQQIRFCFFLEETWLLQCWETIEQQTLSFNRDITNGVYDIWREYILHNGKYSINGRFSGKVICKREFFSLPCLSTRGYWLPVKFMKTCKRPIFDWINTWLEHKTTMME